MNYLQCDIACKPAVLFGGSAGKTTQEFCSWTETQWVDGDLPLSAILGQDSSGERPQRSEIRVKQGERKRTGR